MNEYEMRLRIDCLTPQQQTEVLHELAGRHADLVLPLLPPPALICDRTEYDAGPDAMRWESLQWLRRLTPEDRQTLLEWLGSRKGVSDLSRMLHAARSLLPNSIDVGGVALGPLESAVMPPRRSSAQ